MSGFEAIGLVLGAVKAFSRHPPAHDHRKIKSGVLIIVGRLPTNEEAFMDITSERLQVTFKSHYFYFENVNEIPGFFTEQVNKSVGLKLMCVKPYLSGCIR